MPSTLPFGESVHGFTEIKFLMLGIKEFMTFDVEQRVNRFLLKLFTSML